MYAFKKHNLPATLKSAPVSMMVYRHHVRTTVCTMLAIICPVYVRVNDMVN